MLARMPRADAAGKRPVSEPVWKKALLPLLALAAVGCGEDFDPPHELKTLRVLAVQKDQPYAMPSSVVKSSTTAATLCWPLRPQATLVRSWFRIWWTSCSRRSVRRPERAWPMWIPHWCR